MYSSQLSDIAVNDISVFGFVFHWTFGKLALRPNSKGLQVQSLLQHCVVCPSDTAVNNDIPGQVVVLCGEQPVDLNGHSLPGFYGALMARPPAD